MMFKKIILATIFVSGIPVLCSAATGKQFSSQQKASIEQVIRDQLSDPDSAKFKFPAFLGGQVYCGEVNAKNKMGGYNGFAPFQVFVLDRAGKSSFVVLGVGEPGSSSQALRQSCAEAGYQ